MINNECNDSFKGDKKKHVSTVKWQVCFTCKMDIECLLNNNVDVFGMKVSESLTRQQQQQQLNIENQSNDSVVFMPLSSGKFCFNLNCTQH